jgi:hypothetical protein
MESRTSGATPKANGIPVESTLHALVVTPAVGGVFLLFVAVGMVALAAGVLCGFAANHAAKRGSLRELR